MVKKARKGVKKHNSSKKSKAKKRAGRSTVNKVNEIGATIVHSIDNLSNFLVVYMKEHLKVNKRIEELRRDVKRFLFNIKKGMFQTVIETIFLATAVLAFVAGLLLFLSRYFPLDLVLICYGLFIFLVVLARLRLD